jgi:hypothetical protein
LAIKGIFNRSLIYVLKMESQKSIDDRVNATFMSLGIGTTDLQGMMQHILDCLGALRVRMLDFPIPPKKLIVHNSLRKVFIGAVEVMLEEIDKGEEAHDDGSAKKYLLEQFPDESKMRDGRSWLPLHWATCIDVLPDEFLSTLLKERPIVTGMSAAPASTTANRTKFSHIAGFEEFEDPDENIRDEKLSVAAHFADKHPGSRRERKPDPGRSLPPRQHDPAPERPERLRLRRLLRAARVGRAAAREPGEGLLV